MSRKERGPFRSTEDLASRVSSLGKKGITRLAQIGALNWIGEVEHRRDALWQVERSCKIEGPLLQQDVEQLRENSLPVPLHKMTANERLVADYAGTSLTIDKHPMFYRRPWLDGQDIRSAEDLRQYRDGEFVKAAGCVIARQRPGTAKGFILFRWKMRQELRM